MPLTRGMPSKTNSMGRSAERTNGLRRSPGNNLHRVVVYGSGADKASQTVPLTRCAQYVHWLGVWIQSGRFCFESPTLCRDLPRC